MAVGDKQQSGTLNTNEATGLLQESHDEKKRAFETAKPAKGTCLVRLLDGNELEVKLPTNAKGRDLVDQVCTHVGLVEKEYFSCSFEDEKKVKWWLNHDKTIDSQMKKRPWYFLFELKFYPIDPEVLLEETRFQICLQVRTDILVKKLPCSFATHVLLGSYTVQSEFGDYDIDEHGPGIDYIKQLKFVPDQTEELLDKISRLHEAHRGMTPEEADLNFLDNAKRLAFYGVDMHAAKVRNDQPLAFGDVYIGVSSYGISVYKEQLALYRWSWQKIIQFSYTRNGFKVTVRPKDVFKYGMPYDMAKRLWQIAVEHHAFFRLSKPLSTERASFPKMGSKFRYSGRTQQQLQGRQHAERPVPFINRNSGTKFIATLQRSATMDTSTGYSTDRAEKYHYDDSRSNTLDLKAVRKRNNASMSDLDTSTVPMAGFEDDRNLTAVDPGYDHDDDSHVALLSAGASRVSYTKAPTLQTRGIPPYDQQDNSLYRDSGNQSYRGDVSVNGSRYGYESPERVTSIRQTTINVVMSANKTGPDGDDVLPPYQEDIRRHHAGPDGAGGNWEASPMSGANWIASMPREAKTTSRTYTDSDGNVITEFITEKENIIERRVERRTYVNGEDDVDYDEMLRKAIEEEIGMNQDLSVQKIEIQTTRDQM